MFIIYGKRSAAIKKYNDDSQQCKNCNSFGLSIKVYKEYYHVFYLPIIPIGITSAKIYCKNCKAHMRSNSIEAEYEKKTKAPIYLYAGVLLFLGFISIAILASLKNQKETAEFIESPVEGDVYRVKKNEDNLTHYYFLRVSEVYGDTVYMYHSNLVYKQYTGQFNDDDFFDKSEYYILNHDDLKKMLEKGEIESIARKYDESTGFNRVK